MSTANNIDDVPNICANCGKGEDSSKSLKACTACKLVKYCNRECQIAHRPQHKKECKRRAAELHEEALFKQPPLQYDDCPICFLRMPSLDMGRRYQSCCGKTICSGCNHAPVYDDQGNKVEDTCHFCRTPIPTSEEEAIKRVKKRMETGDAIAIFSLGCYFNTGESSLPQDYTKALELYHRAAELEHSRAYFNIANAYDHGKGVEMDEKKARHYYELAAMGGDVDARHQLGVIEWNAGNYDRALRHFMIAVRGGDSNSVKRVQELFMDGNATKDNYTAALRARQSYLDEIKSDQREKAAAARDDYKYY